MTSEKYIELNLNDERAGKIAEILSNKTAKKILSILTEEELSEGDIAKKLKLAPNTVNYNIKKLIETGFIEKTSSFFWSVKGKKIPTYRIANKKIIISPKSSFKSLVLSSIFGGLVFGGMKIWTNYLAGKDTLEYSAKSLDFVMAPATENAINASSSLSSNIGLWSNVLIYALLGLFIGGLGFLLYNKIKHFVKGGKGIKI